MDSPDCLLMLLSISVFYFVVFCLFSTSWLLHGSMRSITLTYVGF